MPEKKGITGLQDRITKPQKKSPRKSEKSVQDPRTLYKQELSKRTPNNSDSIPNPPPQDTFALEQEGPRGNFIHLKKKTNRFDFEDWSKGKDRLFHCNIATECETYYRAQQLRTDDLKTEHFAFIVDLDAYEYHKVVFHSFLNEVLQSALFRFSILILVVVNSVVIGLQTSDSLVSKYALAFKLVDQIILSVFVFELCAKWIYDFRLFWKVAWNILDFLIILLVILSAVTPGFRESKVIVVVRVVRAFRSLRSVSFLSSLSIVTKTIARSVVDMMNILLVMMIFMFVLSVMGVILFDLQEMKKLDNQYFNNAADAWYAIFICVTQDGWNDILQSIKSLGLSNDPSTEEYFPVIAIYLIIAVSIGAFVFANLIIAVIVANLEASVTETREEQRLLDNPLEYHVGRSENEVDVQPVYDLLCDNNISILSQRPLRIPNLKKFSARSIRAYISLIVALEQNMLEGEIIMQDLERIIAVVLSVCFQLDIYSQQKATKDELQRSEKEAILKSKKIDGTTSAAGEARRMEGRKMSTSKEELNLTEKEFAALNRKQQNTGESLGKVHLIKNRESRSVTNFSSAWAKKREKKKKKL